jgi:hypothetical protein
MPMLTFKDRFVPAVENGLAELRGDPLPHEGVRPKRQSIRALRRDGRDPGAGQRLYLYERARTPEMRKLGEALCRSSMPIRVGKNAAGRTIIVVGAGWPNRRAASLVALADGFASFEELLAFIEETHGLPFRGVIIRW